MDVVASTECLQEQDRGETLAGELMCRVTPDERIEAFFASSSVVLDEICPVVKQIPYSPVTTCPESA